MKKKQRTYFNKQRTINANEEKTKYIFSPISSRVNLFVIEVNKSRFSTFF